MTKHRGIIWSSTLMLPETYEDGEKMHYDSNSSHVATSNNGGIDQQSWRSWSLGSATKNVKDSQACEHSSQEITALWLGWLGSHQAMNGMAGKPRTNLDHRAPRAPSNPTIFRFAVTDSQRWGGKT